MIFAQINQSRLSKKKILVFLYYIPFRYVLYVVVKRRGLRTYSSKPPTLHDL